MTHAPGLVLVLGMLAALHDNAESSCQAQHIDRQATIGKVVDGDTVELSDHTRIRLIGINAPETARRGQPEQALAAQSREALTALLNQSGKRVLLQYGSDRQDRYGRTLAHAFLPDGSNIGQQLLIKGMAVRVAFPPNLWAQDCYIHAEDHARKHQRGLWQHIIIAADTLPANSKGFHIIEGTIDRIGFSKKSVWLNLNANFAVRIARAQLKQFKNIDFKQLKGRTVQVRGWITADRNKRIMHLLHSSMLDIMK